MRKVLGSLVAAGAIAAVVVAPAAAELELCIVDPAVNVDGANVQVGLYTHDRTLADGGVASNTPILVTLVGAQGGRVTTDTSAWQQHGRQTVVDVFNALPDRDKPQKEKLEIDALVPSRLMQDTFYIKVKLPDGSEKTASGRVNTLVHMTVEVPARA